MPIYLRLLCTALMTCCTTVAFALPSYTTVINKVAPIVGWSGDQTQAILFGIEHPDCASKIISYTAAQDYSLVAFIGGLKVTKQSVVGLKPMNAANCKQYNPPERAYAFIDSQGDKLLGKAAADSARDILKPLIAQQSTAINAEIAAIPYVGTILTNWDCGCDAAFDTNFAIEVFADTAVKDGIAIGKAAKAGNFGVVIEKLIDLAGAKVACELGSDLIGTGSIPVVSSVVSNACSGVLGSAVGWLKGAAGTVGQALGIIGYQHINTTDYYNQNWPQHRQGGANMASFHPGMALFNFEIPIYDGCYDYFSKSNMSNDTARQECDEQRARFSNEVVALQATMEEQARQSIGAAYDVKMDGWRANLVKACHVDDPNLANGKGLSQSCNQNGEAALIAGRPAAVAAWKSCQVPSNFSYDIDKCVTLGYQSVAQARGKAVAAVSSANVGFMMQQSIAKGAAAAQSKAKDDAIGNWLTQCPAGMAEKCAKSINDAYGVCQKHIELLPYSQGTPEFPNINRDPVKVKAILLQCNTLYANLVSDYTKIVSKQKLVSSNEKTCVPFNGNPQLSLQCKADLQITLDKCTGGLPKIGYLPNTVQTPPALEDCSNVIGVFIGKWTIDQQAKNLLLVAAHDATNVCKANGLPGCAELVQTKTTDCNASISKLANAVWPVSLSASNFDSSLSNFFASVKSCGGSLMRIATGFANGKEAEVLALKLYTKLCPPKSGKTNYPELCAAELLETIKNCAANGGLERSFDHPSPGKPLPVQPGAAAKLVEKQVEVCKPRLLAVIDKYQGQYTHKNLVVGKTPVAATGPATAAPTAPKLGHFAAPSEAGYPRAGGAPPQGAGGPAGAAALSFGGHMTTRPNGAGTGLRADIKPSIPQGAFDNTQPTQPRSTAAVPNAQMPALTASPRLKTEGANAGAVVAPVISFVPKPQPGIEKPAPRGGSTAPALAPVPATAPAKPTRPDPNLYMQQRRPLLEAPWLARCTSITCRGEVARLIGDRIREELAALGARVDPSDPRAVGRLYSDLDMATREPLNQALKKTDSRRP